MERMVGPRGRRPPVHLQGRRGAGQERCLLGQGRGRAGLAGLGNSSLWQSTHLYPFIFIPTPQILGVGSAVIGDMASRPNWGLDELDFVFATLVVGSIVNFALMYLLAPTGAGGTAAGASLVTKLFSDHYLKAWGAPGV